MKHSADLDRVRRFEDWARRRYGGEVNFSHHGGLTTNYRARETQRMFEAFTAMDAPVVRDLVIFEQGATPEGIDPISMFEGALLRADTVIERISVDALPAITWMVVEVRFKKETT